MIVAVLLGSALGVRYPVALARSIAYLFYAVLGMAVVAWPLSYAYCWHVRLMETAIDVRGGAYYLTEHPGATGFSTHVERFDGYYPEYTMGTHPQRWKPARTIHPPTLPPVGVYAAWLPAVCLSYDIWLRVRHRRRQRREKAIAQPARPGGAGG
jgi:hypothetical protein